MTDSSQSTAKLLGGSHRRRRAWLLRKSGGVRDSGDSGELEPDLSQRRRQYAIDCDDPAREPRPTYPP